MELMRVVEVGTGMVLLVMTWMLRNIDGMVPRMINCVLKNDVGVMPWQMDSVQVVEVGVVSVLFCWRM